MIDDVPIQANDACAPSREARVGCVLDGDTFDIGACGTGAERFRLLGIDAPEVAHESPAECFGNEASAELSRMLLGHEVTLTFDKRCVDVFDRTLAYVWLQPDYDDEEPILINEYMVYNGFAPVDPVWVKGLRMQELLEVAEASAREREVGLWGACGGGGG